MTDVITPLPSETDQTTNVITPLPSEVKRITHVIRLPPSVPRAPVASKVIDMGDLSDKKRL